MLTVLRLLTSLHLLKTNTTVNTTQRTVTYQRYMTKLIKMLIIVHLIHLGIVRKQLTLIIPKLTRMNKSKDQLILLTYLQYKDLLTHLLRNKLL